MLDRSGPGAPSDEPVLSFAADYRVRFDESAPGGVIRPSTCLRYLQDVAWQHSERLGFDRAWYAERGLTWVVRGVDLALLRPIKMGSRLHVTTVVSGFRRVTARRSSDLLGSSGELLGQATIDWAMTDARGRPTRVPPEFDRFLEAAAHPFSAIRLEPSAVPRDGRGVSLHFSVRPQELDPLAHVNNSVYLDWVEEAIGAAGAASELSRLPRRYRLEFLLPAAPAVPIAAIVWPSEGGWRARIESQDAGERALELARATVEVGPSAPDESARQG